MLDATINLSSSSGTEPFNFSINGEVADDTFIDELGPGDYNIVMTDANGCNSSSQLAISNPPLIEPSISGLEVLPEKQPGSYSLSFSSTPVNAEYLWFFENGDTIPGNGPMISDILIYENVNICVDVTYNNGLCVESDCFAVRFEEEVDVYVPNAFSPNNDGQNDIFYIVADDSVAEVLYMRIYDRWGEMVFEKSNFAPNNPDEGWDGRFKGKDLLPGVYVYDIKVITVESKEFPYTGDITIIR
jgi:gliding motility-associated-like protein